MRPSCTPRGGSRSRRASCARRRSSSSRSSSACAWSAIHCRRRTSSTSCSASNVETEISYRLPGLRIEEVHGDQPCRRRAHRDHADHRRGNRGAPDILGVARLGRAALRRSSSHLCVSSSTRTAQSWCASAKALCTAPRLMLINDADTQARWWMRVKDEWGSRARQGRALPNPLEAEDAALAAAEDDLA